MSRVCYPGSLASVERQLENFFSPRPLSGPVLFSTSRCHVGEGSQTLTHYFRSCCVCATPHALRRKCSTTGASQGPCSLYQLCPSRASGVSCPLAGSCCPWGMAPVQNPSSQFQAAQLYRHPMMAPEEGTCHPTGVPQQEHLSSLLEHSFLTAWRAKLSSVPSSSFLHSYTGDLRAVCCCSHAKNT